MRKGFVVAPFTLFEVKFEVRFDAVEFHEPAFGETPESFDAIDVGFAFDKGSALLDANMFVIAHIDQPIIADPQVGMQNASRINPAANDLLERLLATIRDNFGVDPAPSFVDAEDRLLVSGTTFSPRADVALQAVGSKVTFINFDHSS